MKLEKGAKNKFLDGLSKIYDLNIIEFEPKDVPFLFRKERLLNNLNYFKSLVYSETIYCRIHPRLVRHKIGIDFTPDMKDFSWEKFEEKFKDLNDAKSIQQRIYSKFRDYFVGSNLWEFLAEARVTYFTAYCGSPSLTIKIKINNLSVRINLRKFTPSARPKGYFRDLKYEDFFIKFNPYIRQKFKEKGYFYYEDRYDEEKPSKPWDEHVEYGSITFINFTPEILKRKEVWCEQTIGELFCGGPCEKLRNDLYKDDLREICEIIAENRKLKKYFIKAHCCLTPSFCDYSDYEFYNKIKVARYCTATVCDFPLTETYLVEKIKQKHLTCLDLADVKNNQNLNLVTYLRNKLKQDPDNPNYWDYLNYGCLLLFKDFIKYRPRLARYKFIYLSSFFLQRRLIRRDFFREYSIKILSKLQF